MTIIVFSRGLIYKFFSGTTVSAIDSILATTLSDGDLIGEDGFEIFDGPVPDGIYVVRTSLWADFHFVKAHAVYNFRKEEEERKRKLVEDEVTNMYKRRALDQAREWSQFVTRPAIGNEKKNKGLRVRFSLPSSTTFVYSLYTCAMEKPLIVKGILPRNNEECTQSEFPNREEYCKKRGSLNSLGGGWVLVNQGDYDFTTSTDSAV